MHTSGCRQSISILVAAGGCLMCLIGIALRLTVRDSYSPLAIVYYALPLPVIAAIAFPAGYLLSRTGHRRFAGIAWGTACMCAAIGVVGNCSTHASDTGTDHKEVDVLVWNTARGARGWRRVANEIRRFDAPIVGLVEAGPDTDAMRRFWRQELTDRDVAILGRGMVLAVKGRIVSRSTGTLGTESDYAVVDVQLENSALTVVLVDIVSTPWKSRKQPLADLAALLKTLRDRPVVVMGDFNTPPESVHFSAIRSECTNAFETAGDGYASTWPVIFPVLSLDQVWANDRVTFHACRHLWSTKSDHRPVRVTLSIR